MEGKKRKRKLDYEALYKEYTPRQIKVLKEKAKQCYITENGEINIRSLERESKIPESILTMWINDEEWDQLLPPPKDRMIAPKRLKDSMEKKARKIGLTEQEENFCHHYLRCYNATTAAMRAGYPVNTGYKTGSNLLSRDDITEYLKYLNTERNTFLFVDGARIMQEYTKIAFADMTDFVKFSGDTLELRNSGIVDGQMIKKIKSGKDGTLSIELHDKMRALEKLEQFLGTMPDWKRDIELEKLKLAQQKMDLMGNLGENGKLIVNIVDDIS